MCLLGEPVAVAGPYLKSKRHLVHQRPLHRGQPSQDNQVQDKLMCPMHLWEEGEGPKGTQRPRHTRSKGTQEMQPFYRVLRESGTSSGFRLTIRSKAYHFHAH